MSVYARFIRILRDFCLASFEVFPSSCSLSPDTYVTCISHQVNELNNIGCENAVKLMDPLCANIFTSFKKHFHQLLSFLVRSGGESRSYVLLANVMFSNLQFASFYLFISKMSRFMLLPIESIVNHRFRLVAKLNQRIKAPQASSYFRRHFDVMHQ